MGKILYAHFWPLHKCACMHTCKHVHMQKGIKIWTQNTQRAQKEDTVHMARREVEQTLRSQPRPFQTVSFQNFEPGYNHSFDFPIGDSCFQWPRKPSVPRMRKKSENKQRNLELLGGQQISGRVSCIPATPVL